MLTFIDFFAGIGGFRRGMEQAGNGVTVPVIEQIAERMGEYESGYKVSRE